jgi:parallel beta-helix repeat protein
VASGCIVDNNYPTVHSSGNEAEDGMEFKTCDDVTVVNNTFRRQYKDGLEFEDAKNCTATGNVFKNLSPDSDGEAIFIQGTGSGRGLCENITISDNTIKNVDNLGISVTVAQHIDISGNTIQDTTKPPIRIKPGTPATSHISIENNMIDVVGYTANGILVDDITTALDINDNTISSADKGIFIRGCENVNISDNILQNIGGIGIFADQGSGGHTISDNRINSYAQNSFGNGIDTTEADIKAKGNFVGYSSSGRSFRPTGANNRWVDNVTDTTLGNAWETTELTSDSVVVGGDPKFIADLSNFKSVPQGTKMINDGSSGQAGPHYFDGTNWQGYASASGSTI